MPWTRKRKATSVRRKSAKRAYTRKRKPTSRARFAKQKLSYKRKATARRQRYAKKSLSRAKAWNSAMSAIVKPQNMMFKMSWMDSHNFSTDPCAAFNMKVVPGAMFSPRFLPQLQVLAFSMVSGGSNAVTNAQPAGFDAWDSLYSMASVYKSFMKVTILSEATQPLIVCYNTRTGARTGTMNTDSWDGGANNGTLDYVSNINWGSAQSLSLGNQADFEAGPSLFDTMVSGQSPGFTNTTTPGNAPTYTENFNNACHPTRLKNVPGLKKFIWNQSEGQGARTKQITFDVDHRKYVKNWKNRRFVYAKGSTATDNTVGNAQAFGTSNADLLKCMPVLSPVNYLHVATLLPVSGDQESAAQNAAKLGYTDPSTGTVQYASSNGPDNLQYQPIQAIAQSHLSGIIRIQCELIMYARLSSPTQELLDDGDALNATSAAMTY